MQKEGYKRLAKYYDIFNRNKNYVSEARFIVELLKKHNAKNVLDVGCGTGTHISFLEKAGFKCTGIDLNQEMLDIAKEKVRARLIQADMVSFDLNEKFDAIICMFASFNHLVSKQDAEKAVKCFFNHLNTKGVLLLDLHKYLST